MHPSTTLAPRAPTGRQRLKRALERVFGIDLRSLAAFRIGVGLILLYDLILHATHLSAHYTDAGAVPRHLVTDLGSSLPLSLHMLSGALGWQIALFAVAGLAALCLLIGYRTRVAAVVSWLLLLSLHARNPYVINSGDALLLNLMLWATLLPLGARWSIDARRSATRGNAPSNARVFSAATAGILVQVCAIYFLSVFYKVGDTWWGDFTAIYYALHVDAHATALGRMLREAPLILLKTGTIATLILEAGGPLLALSPILTARIRTLAVGVFILFHLGLAATLDLGTFSFVCIAGWLLFLPSEFWDRRFSRSTGAIAWDLSIPRTAVAYVIGVVSIIMAISSLRPLSDFAWNLQPVRTAAEHVRLKQHWTMFAPNPARMDAWYAITGVLEDGTEINLFDPSSEPITTKPASVARTLVDENWRKLLFQHYRSERWAPYRGDLLRFVVDRWNAANPSRPVATASVTLFVEETKDPGEAFVLTEEVLALYPLP